MADLATVFLVMCLLGAGLLILYLFLQSLSLVLNLIARFSTLFAVMGALFAVSFAFVHFSPPTALQKVDQFSTLVQNQIFGTTEIPKQQPQQPQQPRKPRNDVEFTAPGSAATPPSSPMDSDSMGRGASAPGNNPESVEPPLPPSSPPAAALASATFGGWLQQAWSQLKSRLLQRQPQPQ